MTTAQRVELIRITAGSVAYAALYTTVATAAAITTFKLAIRYGGL